jgi:hypothetical protein
MPYHSSLVGISKSLTGYPAEASLKAILLDSIWNGLEYFPRELDLSSQPIFFAEHFFWHGRRPPSTQMSKTSPNF